MGNGAAVSVAAHRRAPWRTAGPLPRLGFRRHAQPAVLPVDGGGQLLHTRGRRDRLVVQRQGRLDQADHSCPTLEVPDVRFDRSDAARRVDGAVDTVNRRQRVDLGGITGRSAGAVGLDEVDSRWWDLRGFACTPE